MPPAGRVRAFAGRPAGALSSAQGCQEDLAAVDSDFGDGVRLGSCRDQRLDLAIELPAGVPFQPPKVEGNLHVQPVPRVDAGIPSQASGGIRRDGPAPGQNLTEAALRAHLRSVVQSRERLNA